MTYFTGLDLHKRSVTATTPDPSGAVVATAKMPCRPDALRAYFAQVPGDHAATVECTTGWYWVRDALIDHVDLTLAHAKGVKAIAAATSLGSGPTVGSTSAAGRPRASTSRSGIS